MLSRSSLPRAFGLFACLLWIAGCQTTESGTPEEAVAGSGVGKEAVAAPGTIEGTGEAEAPKTAPKRIEPVRFKPEEFVGYGPERLLPVLGAPDFVRRDGTAQIWQYRAEHCVLDLFLYGKGNDSRVRHVELRERAPSSESVDACYSRMRSKRQSDPTG